MRILRGTGPMAATRHMEGMAIRPTGIMAETRIMAVMGGIGTM